MENFRDILDLLLSDKRLDRDRGVANLQLMLKNSDELVGQFVEVFHAKLKECNEGSAWEEPHGCMLGAKTLIDIACEKKLDASQLLHLDEFQDFALHYLTHDEVRVRNIGGQLLGSLCRLNGVKVYEKSREKVLDLLEKDLSHRVNDISDDTNSADSSKIFHESAGWRHLETTIKCLQWMIEGCGKLFNKFVDKKLLDLLFDSLTHTNRFVRETGFNACASIVVCGDTDDNSILKFGNEFSHHLARGLADNWSQVRLASSVATRNFLLSLDEDRVKDYFVELVPRLCLNRYYIAEGVRLYSQETWRIISKGHGREIISKYIASVVDYYITATKADNHAVREAACLCISELASKLDREVVNAHVPALLDALLECFQDDSWPVRDAACVACGNFILSYSKEAENKKDILYKLFLGNLQDPIASVRKGAALSLANYTKVYSDQVLSIVMKEVGDGLNEAKNQVETGEKFTGLDKRPAQFGVVKDLHLASDPKHSNQQMYSCGSLAPKMSRGGCSDCMFRRASEPWERSDGCIYLLCFLAEHFPAEVTKLFPELIACLSCKHYSQHCVVFETFCRQLPTIAKFIGKRNFKMHLEEFIDQIFYALSSDVALTATAAEDCLISLAKFLGTNILKGRIENYNHSYVSRYCQVLALPF